MSSLLEMLLLLLTIFNLPSNVQTSNFLQPTRARTKPFQFDQISTSFNSRMP